MEKVEKVIWKSLGWRRIIGDWRDEKFEMLRKKLICMWVFL